MNKITKTFAITLAFLCINVNAGEISDSSINVFSPNTPARSADVNSNFTAIKSAVNDNHQRLSVNSAKINAQGGGNLITNSDFVNPDTPGTADTTNWVLHTGDNFTALPVSGAPDGPFAIQNIENTVAWMYNDQWQPIDRNKTYEASGTFRLLAGGSTGSMYLAVLLRDSSGNILSGDVQSGGSTWWHYPTGGTIPTVDQWIQYKGMVGKGTPYIFPPEATDISVGFILNFNGGNRLYQVQGLGLSIVNTPARWHALPLTSPTINYPGYQAASYRKQGDQVCLRGLIDKAGGTIAVLPATYRPPALNMFVAMGGNNGEADRIDIQTNGDVKVIVNTGSTWTSLEGICFSTQP